MPVIYIVFALNDVIAPSVLEQMSGLARSQIETYYFIGILVGLAVILLLQSRFSINICTMLNISIAFLALGFVVDIVRMQYPDVGLVSAFCFGVALVLSTYIIWLAL